MEITIKKLTLTNFKGIKNMTIDFSDSTDISGENRTGKTTVFDAFTWLLFGKNSSDKKDFSIKTINPDGSTLRKADHEVIGVICVDGSDIAFKKVLREKWVKKRGESTPEFTGNETLYFHNDVPVSQTDYNLAIESIIPESTFKLLTSPYYFNSLPWQTRRSLLFQMAGTMSDKEIAKGNPAFEEILSRNASLETFKKELSARKKLLNETLKAIPTRIDEAIRSKPEPVDVNQVNAGIEILQKAINSIEDRLLSENKAHSEQLENYKQLQITINSKRQRQTEIATQERQRLFDEQNVVASQINSLKQRASSLQNDISSREQTVESLKNQALSLNKEMDSLRAKWQEVNSGQLTFDESQFACPYCKRPLEASDIETKKAELTTNFNTDKQRKLKTLSESGVNAKAQHDRILEAIMEHEGIITTLQDQFAALSVDLKSLMDSQPPMGGVSLDFVLSKNAEYIELTNSILELEATPVKEQPTNDYLIAQKKQHQADIDKLKDLLSKNEQSEKIDQRIQELQNEESVISQQIADIEKDEFTIESFIKFKVQSIEQKINSMFEMVTFKMYNQLINGGEEEACETLINGVPISDANHASQINAGIDIINTFSRFHKTTAPIFVDNAEAVNKLLESNSQMIRLVVSNDKKLKVVSKSKALAA